MAACSSKVTIARGVLRFRPDGTGALGGRAEASTSSLLPVLVEVTPRAGLRLRARLAGPGACRQGRGRGRRGAPRRRAQVRARRGRAGEAFETTAWSSRSWSAAMAMHHGLRRPVDRGRGGPAADRRARGRETRGPRGFAWALFDQIPPLPPRSCARVPVVAAGSTKIVGDVTARTTARGGAGNPRQAERRDAAGLRTRVLAILRRAIGRCADRGQALAAPLCRPADRLARPRPRVGDRGPLGTGQSCPESRQGRATWPVPRGGPDGPPGPVVREASVRSGVL